MVKWWCHGEGWTVEGLDEVDMEEDGDKCLEGEKGWSEVRMDRWIGNNGSKAGHTVFGQRRDTTDRSPS